MIDITTETYRAGEYRVILKRVIKGLGSKKWEGHVYAGDAKVYTVEYTSKMPVVEEIVDKVVAIPFDQWVPVQNGE